MLVQELVAIGVLLTAMLLGGMLFFSAVMAPQIFIRLEAETAARFIRGVFPWYYLFIIVVAVLATAAFAGVDIVPASVTSAVVLSTLVSRQMLMPAINRARDRQLDGDLEAGRRFNRLHRLSVAINTVQIVGLLFVLGRFVF